MGREDIVCFHIVTVLFMASNGVVIIDIGKPPTGALSSFSVYVALSRSRGRDTIRLLRDFDPNLIQHHPSEALRLEMKRLEQLNEATKKVRLKDRL